MRCAEETVCGFGGQAAEDNGKATQGPARVRNVYVLVLHLHEAEVLLGLHLATRHELR